MKTAQELLVDVIKQTSGRWFGLTHNNEFVANYASHNYWEPEHEYTRLVKYLGEGKDAGCIEDGLLFYEFGKHTVRGQLCIYPNELLAANIDGKTYDLRKDD